MNLTLGKITTKFIKNLNKLLNKIKTNPNDWH